MQDKGAAINQVINAGTFLFVAVNFGCYKAHRIAVTERDCAVTEQVSSINAARIRATIVNNYTAVLIGFKLNAVTITLRGNKVLLFK